MPLKQRVAEFKSGNYTDAEVKRRQAADRRDPTLVPKYSNDEDVQKDKTETEAKEEQQHQHELLLEPFPFLFELRDEKLQTGVQRGA